MNLIMLVSRGKYKQEAYEQAIAFRKRGFTYTEIAKICGVSRGTVSNWLAKEDFSIQVATSNKAKAAKDNKFRIALVNKARNAERANKYRDMLASAETEYKHYKTHPLFTAGLMIYLASGDTKDVHVVRLSTSKIELQQVFIRFVVEYLGVDIKALHFWLLLYPGHDEVACMKHWSKKTGLSVSQFGRNQVVPGQNNKRTLQFGVGNTIIGSTLLKKKLNRWLELALKELQKRQ
jgi:transcriptional regulator with XRE-family HTH domain